MTERASRWGVREDCPEPTEPGYDWRCQACRFRTPQREEAEAHVMDEETNKIIEHMMWEVQPGEHDRRKARRRVYHWKGALVVERRVVRGQPVP